MPPDRNCANSLIELTIYLIGKNYLRINSIAENINWDLDDYTEDNLRNIRNMGLDWWNQNNKKVIDFLSL